MLAWLRRLFSVPPERAAEAPGLLQLD